MGINKEDMEISNEILTTPHFACNIQAYLLTGDETFLNELRIRLYEYYK